MNDLNSHELLKHLSKQLKARKVNQQITLMEVCGTHTMAIHRSGLNQMLPDNLRLVSGPGCPVCVTGVSYIDTAIDMAKQHGVTLTTFGDMMRVPGSKENLSEIRSQGHAVEVVYSPLGALELAEKNKDKNIVFLAVGFETTTPTIAATVSLAKEKNIKNFYVLPAHKLVMPALEALISDPNLGLNGFILPGHVSTILGSKPYEFIATKHNMACVITGFEAADVIQGIHMLIDQIETGDPKIEIQYKRVAHEEGNAKARALVDEIYEPCDALWRGFGSIPMSGLKLRPAFEAFDALKAFPVTVNDEVENTGCECGAVLQGKIIPPDCALYGQVCTPEYPIGPCMVSSEGTCAAYYKYRTS
ncbi:MAG: hydrogenase formation protein HypD [bacterium]|nr:hydrogenase formation protein HypD [bacterium]MBU1918054.1 hydrogenase formation protein HypD [bacterium]